MWISWLVPAALWGFALVAVPIAIHLLVRQPSRRVDYPSLRFLRSSQLAAFRPRNIQDALLLICRVAIVAAAVMALAGPVIQSPARAEGYSDRVARAVIIEPGAEPEVVDVAADAFASQRFSRANLRDAVADATRWLDEQPPAAREVVFVGAFRRGSLTAAHLAAVPVSSGLRFVPTSAAESAREVTFLVLRTRNGALVLDRQQASLGDDETRVSGGMATPVAADTLRVIAAPAEQALADAALRAALSAGLRWSDPAARALVVWTGADEQVVQRLLNGATVVRMERPASVSAAATAVRDAVERVTATELASLEPVRISSEQLQAWSRPPGRSPTDARPIDEGDRRWLWVLALALLAVEHGLRRAARSRVNESAAEARVA